MTELIQQVNNLPSTLEDLSRFVLIGREKLNAVRAEIRAIEKVGLAKEVREQKLAEAQDIADAVLDAEVRIGQLMSEVPKATKGTGGNRYQSAPSRENDTSVEFSKNEKWTPPEDVVPEFVEKESDDWSFLEEEQTEKPVQKTKAQIIEEAGFSQKQVERFQTMAAHPEIVEKAKAEARENDEIQTNIFLYRFKY